MPTNTDGQNTEPLLEPSPCDIQDDTNPGPTQADLQQSERRYRRLFEAARDGILILNADTGKVLDANPFMLELLGYDLDHFLGKQLWEIDVFTDKKANQAASAVLKKEGHIRYEHLPLKTKGGDRVEVEFVSNVYHEGNRCVIQCNIRDISERRRMELTLRRQADALAEAVDRKHQFLAMLSHELRNPLGSVLNAVQMLRLGKEAEPIQQKARDILERQVGHMTHLVDDLLEVSRLNTGKVALRLERCDARGVVERAVEAARHEIEAHGHALSVSLPSGPMWLNADPVRLEQVVV